MEKSGKEARVESRRGGGRRRSEPGRVSSLRWEKRTRSHPVMQRPIRKKPD